MAITPTNDNPSLGARVKAFGTKRQNEIIDNIISQLNDLIDGSISSTNLTLSGTLSVGTTSTLTGAVTFGAINTYKGATSLTALAGGAQAGTAIAAEYNNFTTVATALDSAQLPVAALGKKVEVRNSSTKPMAVFGQTGASIDDGAVNTALIVAPNSTVIFLAVLLCLLTS